VNKKKQKNFDSREHLALTVTKPARIKSFLLLFSKEKRFLALPKRPLRL
jgi:hypothetical protein